MFSKRWRDSWTFHALNALLRLFFTFYEVNITDNRVNLGDNKDMQVPCDLQFVGKDKRICLLKKEF